MTVACVRFVLQYARVQEDEVGQYYLERGRIVVEMMMDRDERRLGKMMAFVLQPTDQMLEDGEAESGQAEDVEASVKMDKMAVRIKQQEAAIEAQEKLLERQETMLRKLTDAAGISK
jgi:hypothetical protein